MIYIPALDECVYAAEGCGAWYVAGGQRAAGSPSFLVRTLADGFLSRPK